MEIGTILNSTPMKAANDAGSSASVKGAGQSDGADFANALQGMLTSDDAQSEKGSDLPTEEMMAALMPIISQIVQLPVNELSDAETTLTNVLQGLNNDSAFADRFMKDPKVSQWLSEAASMLQALGALPGTGQNQLQAAQNAEGSQGSQLQAQKVLLSFGSMLQEQPNNAVLKGMLEEFQALLEPHMNDRAISADSASLVNAALGKSEVVKANEAKKGPAAIKTAGATEQVTLPSNGQQVSITTVQSVKSKLELLSAKTAALSFRLAEPNMIAADENDAIVSPLAESTDSTLSTMPLMDVFKTIAASENAVKGQSATISAHNFAEEMSSHMFNSMKITLSSDGLSEAKLNLFPEHLGHVSVKIAVHQGQMIAQFAAETAAGREMLEAQLPQLRQMLQSQGLQVEKLEVSQQQTMQSGMFQDQRQGQAFGQSAGQNQGQSSSSSQSYADDAEFFEQLAETVQTRRTSSGNTFEATI